MVQRRRKQQSAKAAVSIFHQDAGSGNKLRRRIRVSHEQRTTDDAGAVLKCQPGARFGIERSRDWAFHLRVNHVQRRVPTRIKREWFLDHLLQLPAFRSFDQAQTELSRRTNRRQLGFGQVPDKVNPSRFFHGEL